MPNAAAFLAEVDGVPSAAATACIRDRLVHLFGDATLKGYRRRGLHSALISARLGWGVAQGAIIASASVVPGSDSQRNYLRAGFQIAYTKMNMCREG